MAGQFIRHKAFAIIAVGVLALGGCGNSGVGGVERAYYSYARALDEKSGFDATKLATDKTLSHFEKLRQVALRGDRGRLQLTMYDEVSIYYLRYKFSAEMLSKFAGRDVLSALVEVGLVDLPDMQDMQLTEIEIEGDEAWALLDDGDETTDYRIKFAREKGKWKIDDAPLRASREEVLVDRMMSFKASRDKLVEQILRSVGVRTGITDQMRRPLIS